MRKRTDNHFEIRDTMSLAGWLFADLLLGLSMLFLVFNTVGKTPVDLPATPTPTITLKPSTTPLPTKVALPTLSPSLTPTEQLPGLGPAQCYNLDFDSNNVKLQTDNIVRKLKTQIPNDKNIKAGLVLIWTHGETQNEAIAMSQEIAGVIKSNFPDSFGTDTQYKSLYFGFGSNYTVQIEAYFLTTTPWISGKEVPCVVTE